ncbi:hypothetical protein AKJ40_01695 [candidate division MSBL1 archaeon SCGC-AAA259M10]|uniref:ABC transporter domain-containing protein n=1 Tax=candidate division MSBL1 archaeon SCGC-AAA259M10 TaxID=1698270 RepID=A0A133V169_9EURY|nr:hypothetical protein AKJ40_01695 [candidate division MSBL1 archaeon SCGC-AAA259M10]
MAKNKVLTVKNLNSGYGKAQVLDHVSIEAYRGEITLLIGTNESGKTTLLKTICGLVEPWSGEMMYHSDGEEISLVGRVASEIAEMGIVYIPDERSVFPELTVKENLMIGSFREKSRDILDENLEIVYDMFPKLKERSQQNAGTLSGGEKQMVAVGKALMADPDFLLMDEPSLGLAPILVKNLFEIIDRLKEEYGLSIFLTEQNFEQSIKIGDRGYIIVDGEITFEGDKSELKDSEMVSKHYLGGAQED